MYINDTIIITVVPPTKKQKKNRLPVRNDKMGYDSWLKTSSQSFQCFKLKLYTEFKKFQSFVTVEMKCFKTTFVSELQNYI